METTRIPTVQLTSDIKPQWHKVITEWLNVTRRLQSVGRRHEGHAVLSIHVVVNDIGIPVLWTEPKLVKLEPKGSDCAELLKTLTDTT